MCTLSTLHTTAAILWTEKREFHTKMLLFRWLFVFTLSFSFFAFRFVLQSTPSVECRMAYVSKVGITFGDALLLCWLERARLFLHYIFLAFFRTIHFLRIFQNIPLHALLVSQIVFIYFLCLRFIHPFNFKAKMKLITCTNIYVCAMKYMKIVYFIGL